MAELTESNSSVEMLVMRGDASSSEDEGSRRHEGGGGGGRSEDGK